MKVMRWVNPNWTFTGWIKDSTGLACVTIVYLVLCLLAVVGLCVSLVAGPVCFWKRWHETIVSRHTMSESTCSQSEKNRSWTGWP